MIVVTGAAGFVGSALVGKLNKVGITHIVLVDEFKNDAKAHNLVGKKYQEKVDRSNFISWLKENEKEVQFIYHIGARTDTTEMNTEIFDRLNLNYSKEVWKCATQYGIPLIYASSAATYGAGEHGYNDDHRVIEKLTPLNPYGVSKNDFDKWVMQQKLRPPFWAGLKFFNVYGPNEYHKGRMASVVFHAYRQIMHTGKMNLFRSHKEEYDDGEQKRDFIYIKDLLNICLFLREERPESGLYNVGLGKARTFNDLTKSVFKALDKEVKIDYIDIPEDIRENYQYYTEANINKIIAAGYKKGFHTIEQGIKDYVQNYLIDGKYL